MSNITPFTGIAGFNPAQLPSALLEAMGGMTSSELQEGVGPSYAVVSIKGKSFTIRHGGVDETVTVDMNGQKFAAPFFDVVILSARRELSKTWYKSTFTEGSAEQPDCWSEDGVTPLAPLENRPLDPHTGTACMDCRRCPMNVFGSKVSNDGTATKGKACSDTRKLAIVPVTGAPGTGPVDVANVRWGGPMLLRVPPASLKEFAEFDAKLNSMGLPYFGVVTRMQFDTSQAYPKFVLQPVRVLSDLEARDVIEARNGNFVRQMLEQGHTAAPALPAPAAPLTGGSVGPAASQVANAPQVTPVPTPVPVAAVPAPAPAPVAAPPAPPAPPPVQPAFPPEGWTAHPDAAGYFYRGQEVLSEAQLRERMAPQAPPAPPVAPPPPPVQLAPPPAASAPPAASPALVPPQTPAGATIALTPGVMDAVDNLLGT